MTVRNNIFSLFENKKMLDAYADLKDKEMCRMQMGMYQDQQGIKENTSRYIDTGNSNIDSILNHMSDEIYKAGGTISLKIKIDKGIPVDDLDINIILSNLLLNAYEAIQKCADKEIDVAMKYDRGILLVKIQNSYDGVVKKKFGSLQSTKDDKGVHGIGLYGVREAVRRYHGDMKIDYDENKFKVIVLLYVLDHEGRYS